MILYRHFDSKTDLYQAVLDRMCARLDANVAEPVGGFTDASIDGLLAAAVEDPAGFRPRIDTFRADITAAAYTQISSVVPDERLARWASQLAPVVAIEAIIAWLDAGRPDPAQAAARVRQVIGGVIFAAGSSEVDCSLPNP